MISEKQQDMLCQGIIFHFLGSDRSKEEQIRQWVQTLDHSQASPIIAKFIALKHNSKLTSDEWSSLEEEAKQELQHLGLPFIQ